MIQLRAVRGCKMIHLLDMSKAQKRQEAILAFAKGREAFQIGDILSGIGGDFSVYFMKKTMSMP